MVRVFVEARPKGRPEGSPIEDYVVEDHADQVLQTFKTQHEAIEWAKKTAHAACRSRSAPERQGKARSLARGLGAALATGGTHRSQKITPSSLTCSGSLQLMPQP